MPVVRSLTKYKLLHVRLTPWLLYGITQYWARCSATGVPENCKRMMLGWRVVGRPDRCRTTRYRDSQPGTLLQLVHLRVEPLRAKKRARRLVSQGCSVVAFDSFCSIPTVRVNSCSQEPRSGTRW
ncbi:hypothetical protein OH77DRAFT_1209790 [Trametes cingulata]|nr:hypothetical protein OH77DRAFT_1209790 [Trametes cingulata]